MGVFRVTRSDTPTVTAALPEDDSDRHHWQVKPGPAGHRPAERANTTSGWSGRDTRRRVAAGCAAASRRPGRARRPLRWRGPAALYGRVAAALEEETFRCAGRMGGTAPRPPVAEPDAGSLAAAHPPSPSTRRRRRRATSLADEPRGRHSVLPRRRPKTSQNRLKNASKIGFRFGFRNGAAQTSGLVKRRQHEKGPGGAEKLNPPFQGPTPPPTSSRNPIPAPPPPSKAGPHSLQQLKIAFFK